MAPTELERVSADPVRATLGEPFRLRLQPVGPLTPRQFLELCAANRPWQLEYTAQGDVLIMAPEGGKSSYRNAEIGSALLG